MIESSGTTANGNTPHQDADWTKAVLRKLPVDEESGRAWAEAYFERLKRDPESVALAGILDDAAETEATISGFGDALQEIILKAMQSPVISAERALEMATEVSAQRSRMYSLCSAISVILKPAQGEDSPESNALALTEILEEMLGDIAQENRLLTLLRSMAGSAPASAALNS